MLLDEYNLQVPTENVERWFFLLFRVKSLLSFFSFQFFSFSLSLLFFTSHSGFTFFPFSSVLPSSLQERIIYLFFRVSFSVFLSPCVFSLSWILSCFCITFRVAHFATMRLELVLVFLDRIAANESEYLVQSYILKARAPHQLDLTGSIGLAKGRYRMP